MIHTFSVILAMKSSQKIRSCQPHRKAQKARRTALIEGGYMTDHLKTLREMRERAMEGGGPERIAQQHARGKMTARERLALLLDEGTFQELGALATHNTSEFGMDQQRFPGDGVVTGFGKISGRRVAVFAQDFTVVGGSFSEVQANKICRMQDVAL
jgi:acetyl-CoA carboxylase carboxyltransferase component